MKLYRNLVHAVAQILQDVFRDNRYADKAIERAFRQNPAWGSRDRRFVAEGVYDCVRNYRLYSCLAESDRNFWFITSVWLVLKDVELPDWPEFRHVNPVLIKKRHQELLKEPAVALSYPDWLWKLGSEELGNQDWQREAGAMHQQAEVYLRVNTLKTNRARLIEQLKESGLGAEPVSGTQNALRLLKRENIFRHPLFKEGHFEVQDAGSQLIAEFTAAKAGHTVVDACAGAGGKSLHLAALMNNKGRVYSLDVEAWKLEELKKRAVRAGAFNIETRLIEGDHTISELAGKADCLLLDVPCSGLGVLKRNPDAKWKLNPEVIERTKNLQAAILQSYHVMLKPGGVLIYSTCSLLPSENGAQVNRFLENNPSFRLLEQKSILPSSGFDGFYMARLKKKA